MENASLYKSLIFFDLETTGLPQEGRPEITEVSLIGCSVSHFLSTPKDELPRVLHKLTLCLNPGKRIPPVVCNITGLDNLLLENEKKLDKTSLQYIMGFFSQLQQPAILVAHNGNKFDFPIFRRYCDENELSVPLDCVDSLDIFKQIERDDDENLDIIINSQFFSDEMEENQENQENGRPQSPDLFEQFDDPDITDLVLSQVVEEAEQKASSSMQSFNERTPSKRTRNEVPPRISSKRNKPERNLARHKPALLFKFNKSYKLCKIYERFFNKEPEIAHRAEDDALLLLKCAQACNKSFLRYIPTYKKNLFDP